MKLADGSELPDLTEFVASQEDDPTTLEIPAEGHRRIELDVALTQTTEGERLYMYDRRFFQGTLNEVAYTILGEYFGDLWHRDFEVRTIRYEAARRARGQSPHEGRIVIVFENRPDQEDGAGA